MDKVNVNRSIPLRRFNAAYYNVTTTDDPVIAQVFHKIG